MIVTASARRMSKPVVTTPDPVVLIRSSAYSSLPAPGNRIDPADVADMPKIVPSASGSTHALQTASGAHHYRLVGINFEAHASGNQQVVTIGTGEETALGQFTSDITLDRCIIKGDVESATTRGLRLEAIRGAVIDSYIYECKSDSNDSQAIMVSNSPGPLKIVNNFLEGAGENMMLGGADPTYANSVPSDIEIRRNYFKKQSAATWVSSWSVKNLLEFKNAQRVLVEGNVLETHYADPNGQSGWSLVITPRNQEGGAPWCVTQDLTFRYNKMTDVDAGINILGTDDINTSEDTIRIDFQHNFIKCDNSSAANLRLLQFTGADGNDSIKVVHNTLLFADGAGNAMAQVSGPTGMTGFVFRDNIVSRGLYGFRSDTESEGTNTINGFFTTADFTYNVKIGSGGTYPATNQTAADYAAVGFTDSGAGDYSLAGSSGFKGDASDATDPGADWTTLTTKTANAIDGQWGSEHTTYVTESQVNAELPRSYINTTYANQTGTTHVCTTAAHFTTALANAVVGDIIELQAGATFTGSFTLRAF